MSAVALLSADAPVVEQVSQALLGGSEAAVRYVQGKGAELRQQGVDHRDNRLTREIDDWTIAPASVEEVVLHISVCG